MKLWPIIILFTAFILNGCSCSKEEERWGPTEMWKMAQKAEPSIELVFLADTPEGRSRRVLCEQYRLEGCIPGSGKRILVRMVEILVIQYETKVHACKAALEIGQWYARNWIFDDVTNEPVLEDFVQKVFSATKPTKSEDCEF